VPEDRSKKDIEFTLLSYDIDNKTEDSFNLTLGTIHGANILYQFKEITNVDIEPRMTDKWPMWLKTSTETVKLFCYSTY